MGKPTPAQVLGDIPDADSIDALAGAATATTSCGFLLLDESGRVTHANIAAGKQLGIDPASMVGRPLWTFIDPEQRQGIQERLETLGQAFTEPATMTVTVSHPDGLRHLRWEMIPHSGSSPTGTSSLAIASIEWTVQVKAEHIQRKRRALDELFWEISGLLEDVSAQSPQTAMERIVSGLADIISCSSVVASSIDLRQGRIIAVAEWRRPGLPSRLEMLQGVDPRQFDLSMRRLREDGALVLTDVREDLPLASPDARLLAECGLVALLEVPIMVEGDIAGSIGIEDDQPRQWLEHEIESLKLLAGMIGYCMERVRSRATIAISEERFRVALDATTDGLFDWNIATGKVHYGAHWTGMLGYGPDDVQGVLDDFWRLLHPDDRPRIEGDVRKHLAGETLRYHTEFRLRTRSGDYRWILARGQIVSRDEKGHPTRMVGTHSDITDRKIAEQNLHDLRMDLERRVEARTEALIKANQQLRDEIALRENTERSLRLSEARYRTVSELLMHCAYAAQIDDAGRMHLLWASDGLRTLTGYELAALRERGDWMSLIHKEDLGKFQGRLDSAAEGQVQILEYRIVRSDGVVRWIRDLARPMEQSSARQGRLVLGAAVDITDERRTQNRLKVARFALDSAVDGVIWLDARGTILDANESASKLLLPPDGQLIHRSWWQFERRISPRIWRERWEILQREHAWRLETQLASALSGLVDVELTASLVRNENELIACVFIRDIRDKLEAQRRQSRYQQELREAQKYEALGSLAAGIAHDFNNLILAIDAANRATLMQLDAQHPAQPTLAIVGDVCQTAREITTSLLMFARRESPEKRALDMVALVAGSIRLVTRLLPRSIRLRIKLPPLRNIRVLGNATSLNQLLINLAVNARDAMPEGGLLTISVHTCRHQGVDVAVLSVSDTGHGMDEVTVKRIFEPFFTTRPRGRGTGLGLPVVHGIAQDHDATIDVRSAPDRGSSFQFRFRLLDDEKPPRGDQAVKDEPPVPAMNGRRIVLVDDLPDHRAVLARLLAQQGVEVEELDTLSALLDARTRPDFSPPSALVIDADQSNAPILPDELNAPAEDIPIVLLQWPAIHKPTPSHVMAQRCRIIEKPYEFRNLLRTLGELPVRSPTT
ncbi:MAG: PAS domain S-box protein [Phycisphaeraceae bacterium]|nr:PAS domain S-box protein [Phycisphaeraceae bacterium]